MGDRAEHDKITLDYYDEHARDYAEAASSADLGSLLGKFLECLPPTKACGLVLDLGCGPGRDAKAMMEAGYDVEMIDGSAQMCRVARDLTGGVVRQMLFSELDDQDRFCGIWACAALLHVPKSDLDDVVGRCFDALKDGGVMYASFKRGERDGYSSGRYFTDMASVDEAVELFEGCGFDVFDAEVSQDTLGRDVCWINLFARK